MFNWLLNLAGITSLLVWMSCGLISLRFRFAWRMQGRSLADLPYVQPLFPVLPILVVVLGTLMFAAEGYAAVASEPFEASNVVATYIGVATFVLLYAGYALYERFGLKKTQHLVQLAEVDLDRDAVWGSGRLRKDVEENHAAEDAQPAPLLKRILRNAY